MVNTQKLLGLILRCNALRFAAQLVFGKRRVLGSPHFQCDNIRVPIPPARIPDMPIVGTSGDNADVDSAGRVDRAPFELLRSIDNPAIVCGRRIGISAAIETPWRFGLKGSCYLSRPFYDRGT